MVGAETFDITEYCAWQEIAYTWARSIDKKDWSTLGTLFTPKFTFDYTEVYGFREENMSPANYVALIKKSLGDPETPTQHLLTASKVRKLSTATATVEFQIRAAHMRITKNPRNEVAKGHAHGIIKFSYQKMDDGWKVCGLSAVGDFMEGDILGVFPSWPGKGNDVAWAV